MTLRTWVQEFQTLIVGVVGFAGVILTLVLNARYTREQRREERRHERQTLRVALVEELRINREWVVRETEKTKDLPETGWAVPTDAMDDVYRTFTDRIGLLSPEEMRKVMYAYLSLQTFHASLLLVGVPIHTGARYVKVPSQNAPMLLGLQRSLIAPIDEAIGVLERARDAG